MSYALGFGSRHSLVEDHRYTKDKQTALPSFDIIFQDLSHLPESLACLAPILASGRVRLLNWKSHERVPQDNASRPSRTRQAAAMQSSGRATPGVGVGGDFALERAVLEIVLADIEIEAKGDASRRVFVCGGFGCCHGWRDFEGRDLMM